MQLWDVNSNYRTERLPVRTKINVANISDNGLIMAPCMHNAMLSTESLMIICKLNFSKKANSVPINSLHFNKYLLMACSKNLDSSVNKN